MIENKGLVSFIIPTYNREEFVEECIDSVLKQSYQNFEIVIVDDGSLDNTYEICKRLAKDEPRIKLFRSSHGGVSVARNIALDEALGEYVFFLDSDDVIHPCLIESFVRGMEENKATIAATRVANVRPNLWYKVRERCKEQNVIGELTYIDADGVIDSMLNGSDSPIGCIGGIMMHRNLIGSTRFKEDIYIGEDFYFIYENIIKGATGAFLTQKWYYARIHENNSSWDYSFNGFWTRFYRRKLVWESEEKLGRIGNSNTQKRDAYRCYWLCAEKNKPYSDDCKQMRKVLKEYKNTLFPALSIRKKIEFNLYIYLPATTKFMYSLKGKIRRLLRKFKAKR